MDKNASYAFALPKEQVTFVAKDYFGQMYFGLWNDDPVRLEKAAHVIEKTWCDNGHWQETEEEGPAHATRLVREELQSYKLDDLLVNAIDNDAIIPACQFWYGRSRYYFEHLNAGKACPGPANAEGKITESSALFGCDGQWRQGSWQDEKDALMVRSAPFFAKKTKGAPEFHVHGMEYRLSPETIRDEGLLWDFSDVIIGFAENVPKVTRAGSFFAHKKNDDGLYTGRWGLREEKSPRKVQRIDAMFQQSGMADIAADTTTRMGQVNAIVNRFGFAATPMKISATKPVFN